MKLLRWTSLFELKFKVPIAYIYVCL